MKPMYPAVVNSPSTELAADITVDATEITVISTAGLPPAPNMLTIGIDETAETVRYSKVDGKKLTVERGFQGISKSWSAGTKVARYFTAYDHDAFRENVEALFGTSLASNGSVFIPAHEPFRAWQGVCTDGTYIYLVTDNPETGIQDHENIISVYDLEGNFIYEKRNAYSRVDSDGKQMSFGDISFINNVLYVTAYNINGGGAHPYESRVITYSSYSPEAGINMIQETDIGDGVAECVAGDSDGFLWMSYHDRQIVRKFDVSLALVKEYPLPTAISRYGGYQGLFWENGLLHANMHGPNFHGDDFEGHIDVFQFDNEAFVLLERITPPTFGTTQGMCAWKGVYLFNDRSNNGIVIVKNLRQGNVNKRKSISLRQSFVRAVLVNNYEVYDKTYDRSPKFYQDIEGRIHFSGICKPTTSTIRDAKAFALPLSYIPEFSLNICACTNLGVCRLVVVGNNSTTPDLKGHVIPFLPPEVEWVSFDGISFLADPSNMM